MESELSSQHSTTAVKCDTVMNPIITLLLEEDIIFLPEPGVRHVARIRLGLTGEECILGYVHGYVLWRGDDKWRSCKPKKQTKKQKKKTEWKFYFRFIPVLPGTELCKAIMLISYELQPLFESLLNAAVWTDWNVKICQGSCYNTTQLCCPFQSRTRRIKVSLQCEYMRLVIYKPSLLWEQYDPTSYEHNTYGRLRQADIVSKLFIFYS